MAEATPAPHEAPVGGSSASLAAYAAARSSGTTSAAFKPAGDRALATLERSLTTTDGVPIGHAAATALT